METVVAVSTEVASADAGAMARIIRLAPVGMVVTAATAAGSDWTVASPLAPGMGGMAAEAEMADLGVTEGPAGLEGREVMVVVALGH